MRICTSLLFCAATVVSTAVTPAQSQVAAAAPGAQRSSAATGQKVVTDDPRWSAWLGCWTPAATTRADGDTQVCIVPAADGHGVRMLTFAGNTETLAENVVADGSPQTTAEKDCTGERFTRWSSNGARLFSSSTLRCEGRPESKTSGIGALIAADRWIDVQVIDTAGRQQQVRTRRFWRSSVAPPGPVAEIIAGLTPVRQPLPPPTVDDVIEASRNVASVGVEAWIAESNARVPVDRRALLDLSDAHVSANLIDLMVALAFPKKFEVRRTSSSSSSFGADWTALADLYGLGYGCFDSPYCFGYGGYYPPGDWYLEPGGGGGGGGGSSDTTHGLVVNGRGYTRVQPREPDRAGSGSRSGGDSISSSGSSDGGSTSGSGSSSASPAGYSGGGGTSTGLTAVPR